MGTQRHLRQYDASMIDANTSKELSGGTALAGEEHHLLCRGSSMFIELFTVL